MIVQIPLNSIRQFAGMKEEIEKAKPTEEEIKEAAGLVANWQRHGGTSFATKLLSLFGKADTENRKKLARGFPALAQAWLDWQFGGINEI